MRAYDYADAMLCERGRANHDAVPEATARTDADRDRTDKAAARPGEGTGDIPCPRARETAAYAVYLHGEYDSSYGPDSIDEALEIAAECSGEVVPLYRTPQSHATPGEGSVQQEPVAWAILHQDHQYVSLLREHAHAHNVSDAEIVPLYRSPALTDAEREAIEEAMRQVVESDCIATPHALEVIDTLRGLLERTK